MADRRDAEPHLADLRLRLYRPDASTRDVQRYLAEQDAQQPDEPEAAASPTRSRRPLALGAVLAIAAAAALVLGVRLSQPSTPPPSPAATSAVMGDEVLDGGRRIDGPAPVPVQVDGVAVEGQRFRGTGSAAVDVAAPQAALDGGRVLVDVTTSGPARVGWTATSLVSQADWTTFRQEVSTGAAWSPFGTSEPTWSTYSGQPPTRIEIDAPEGIGWTLVVAFDELDASAPR